MILMDQMNKNIDVENQKWLQNLVKNQKMEQTNEQLSSTINMHPNIIHDIKILKN